jgi:hypothetical protein
VSAKDEGAAWVEAVTGLAKDRDLRYEPVGGLNQKGAPAALCPGGTNRLTGELVPGFWGAACDADEHEAGGFGRRAIVPGAVLAKAHMPDLATVVPIFHVESLERTPGDMLDRTSRRRVEFESVEFNKRFIATVPRDHDPVALRELFSPAFLVWTTQLPAEVDFGITDRQLFFHWRLRELTRDELDQALRGAGGIFERLRREMVEQGLATYAIGPWYAGMEPFPTAGKPRRQ